MFTVTGRLRANTTFSSIRNNVFQGAAADGAVMAMWLAWRASYKLVDFVHDQLVVESPADELVAVRVAALEELMIRGMPEVAPGMAVKVETVVTNSLNKKDLDPRYNDESGLARRDVPVPSPSRAFPVRDQSRGGLSAVPIGTSFQPANSTAQGLAVLPDVYGRT